MHAASRVLLTSTFFEEEIEEMRAVNVVCMDFSRAFDNFPRERLIQKIEIHDDLVIWISNWLIHSIRKVVVEGRFSG